MVLIIDTAVLDPKVRIEAIDTATNRAEVCHLITHLDASGHPHHRLEVWGLGPGSSLMQLTGTAIRIERGPRQLRKAGPARVALGIQLNRPSARSHLGAHEFLAVGDLVMTDLTSSHSHTWPTGGGCRSFNIDYDRIGLDVSLVRRAIPRLKQSPLYSLLQEHLSRLCLHQDLSASPAAAMLGASTTELLRALVTTAVDDQPGRQSDALENSLPLRIKSYVQHHLTDPALNAEIIAAAHNVSVRQVYQSWSVNDISLAQWIIRARLEGARRELARPGRAASVLTVAKHWAFADPTHFSRRFRAAYGMSPRDWQQLHAQ